MKCPRQSPSSWPALLLLPLLAVLLFGKCGGGVHAMLSGMGRDRLGNDRRAQFQRVVLRRRAERAAAQQLHGRNRQEAYLRIERATNVRINSLIRNSPRSDSDWERNKFHKRRNKVERQLLRSFAPTS